MAVYIGGASIDENGQAHGGQAGNQSGRELRRQTWYLHKKGWRVFRAKDAEVQAKLARCMEMAIANRHIGYDQYQRNTLYKAAEPLGFDVSKVTADVETDCSALVRVCCAYAGILGLPSEFRTVNEPTNLLKTGRFDELVGDKYTRHHEYLRAGDILVTPVSGHTVIVLTDGLRGRSEAQPEGLTNGDYGSAVEAMQRALLLWDPACLPRFGVDGDFGSETEAALKAYQAAAGLPVTGVYDAATRTALTSIGRAKQVRITGATVNVRSAPSLSARVLGVVTRDTLLPYQDESQQGDGRLWHLVDYKGQNGWVSERMGVIA